MSDFDFSQLDLTDVQVKGSRLRAGNYVCTITEPEIKHSKTGGRYLSVKLVDKAGEGSIGYNITLENKNTTAVQIGRETLKDLLTKGGHPSPNKPGAIDSIKNLIVGIRVVQSEYKDKDDMTRMGSEVKQYNPFFNPKENGVVLGAEKMVAVAPKQESKSDDFDDDIPF